MTTDKKIDRKDLQAVYASLNRSFKKTLVFRIGIDAGFFSEFNYLIFTMLYCLEHKIQFKLYSDDANFAYEKGWSDYFEPFCEEVHDRLHARYNVHPPYTSWRKAFREMREKKDLSLLRWRMKSELLACLSKWARFWNRGTPFHYYTQDLLDKIALKNKHYYIPQLGIDGDYVQAYNVMYELVWNLRPAVEKEVETLIRNLSLPAEYVAFQIRGGDKFMEYNLLSVELYLKKLREVVTSVKDIFVLTDDYSLFAELRQKGPEYTWHTFCQKEEQGYYNAAFSQTATVQKKAKMIRFFASVKLLEKASLMVGTITATPCVVIGIRRALKIEWVDFDKDYFFDSIDYSIEKKKTLSEHYLQHRNV